MAEGFPRFSSPSRDTRLLFIILAVFGVLLTLTVVPGVFIIDEDNYLVSILALRQGGFVAPDTELLSRSRELAYFDPEPQHREVAVTPLVPLVAPLYAFITLPFSYLGWRALVFLNTLAFLGAALILFNLAKKVSSSPVTPWVACMTYMLGGYSIEYAQGMWPHMLSTVMCFAAFYFLVESVQQGSAKFAALAGVFIGLATGVREQNIFTAGCFAITLLIFSRRRYAPVIGYLLGLSAPLIVVGFINLLKVGYFHPFPKLYGYVSDVTSAQSVASIHEPLRVFWAKVVDFSFSGSISDPIKAGLFNRAPASGAILVYGIVKKALIQSSPWIGLVLIGTVTAWFSSLRTSEQARTTLRSISLVVLPTLFMVGLAGFNRTDALSFNQRYFIELLPFSALALGLLIENCEMKAWQMVVGFVLGGLLVIGILNLPSAYSRYAGQLKIPILLSIFLIIAWAIAFLPVRRTALYLIFGVTLGWSLLIHLQTDLMGSRNRRSDNFIRYEILRNVVPDHSALFAYWGNKDAAGPLQLDRDVVILDLWADEGNDASKLIDELLAQHRRVFILLMDIPEAMLEQLLLSRPYRRFSESFMNFVEILERKPDSP